jgi:hypothetical protein
MSGPNYFGPWQALFFCLLQQQTNICLSAGLVHSDDDAMAGKEIGGGQRAD